jgi:hypothetical protein
MWMALTQFQNKNVRGRDHQSERRQTFVSGSALDRTETSEICKDVAMRCDLFKLLVLSVILGTAPLVAQDGAPAKGNEGKKAQPEKPLTAGSLAKLLIFSKEITRVTDHKTKQGLPDYAAALNDHFGKGVLPEENGAVSLYEGFGPEPEGARMSDEFFELLGMPVPSADGKYFRSFSADLPVEERRDAIDKEFNFAYERPWNEDEFPRVEKWLRENEKAVATIVEGASRPKYFSPLVPPVDDKGVSNGLIGTLLPGIQQSRSVARYLICRSMLSIRKGDADAAWQDLMSCHRFGHMISRGPTLIDYLVGTAINQIATNADIIYLDQLDLNVEQLARCRRDLASLPPMPSVAQKLDWTERMMFLDSALLLGCGQLNALDLGTVPSTGMEALATRLALLSVDWNVVLRTGNERYDRVVVGINHDTYSERAAALAAFEDELKDTKKNVSVSGFLKATVTEGSGRAAAGKMMGDVLSALLLPAISAVNKAHGRAEQTRHNLHIAFALAEWKQKNGSYPDSLNKLVPAYMPKAPTDVFTGKTLQYRREGDGFLIYSVGVNLDDENGLSYDDDPAGDDLVVRLPIPVAKDDNQDN